MYKRTFCWVLVLAILIGVGIGTSADVAVNDSNKANGWAGSWQSDELNLTFTQNGDAVSGLYHPVDMSTADPGVIEGTLLKNGTELSGTWTETGTLTLTLADDGSSFNGTYGYVDSEKGAYTGPWNGTRISNNSASEPGWTGTWQTNIDNLTTTQTGNSVKGMYYPMDPSAHDEGTMEGNLSENGKVLTGTWIETGGLVFMLSDDGSYFNGTYGFGTENSMNGKFNDGWNGTRIL